MDKLATWVLIGLLTYICFVLTSIDSKMDASDISRAQYAVLNEVKTHSLSDAEVRETAMTIKAQPVVTPGHAGLALLAMISVFLSWQFSRIYHNHQWTKAVLKKRYAPFSEPYAVPEPREPLHPDQDCIGDPPPPDGRIKISWLPAHVKRLDSGFGG